MMIDLALGRDTVQDDGEVGPLAVLEEVSSSDLPPASERFRAIMPRQSGGRLVHSAMIGVSPSSRPSPEIRQDVRVVGKGAS